MSQESYLILGTSFMFITISVIIVFIFIYYKKLAAREKAHRETERLMKGFELKAAYAMIEGQEQERKRIASELHDNIGSMLATLKIYSDLMFNNDDKEILRLNLKLNQLTENLSAEVRKLSHELDSRTLAGFGFKTAVEQLCEAIINSGKLEIVRVLDLTKPLSEFTALNLYRILQELFTNTLKHAMATSVRLEISQIDNDLSMIYEDNGQGFDIGQIKDTGMGIHSIRSRVNSIHGILTIDSSGLGSAFIIEIIENGRNNNLHS